MLSHTDDFNPMEDAVHQTTREKELARQAKRDKWSVQARDRKSASSSSKRKGGKR